MEICESNLKFVFNGNVEAIKFDNSAFYAKRFNTLPEGKGVDIILDCPSCCQLIEIKNCTGHESENMWRTVPDNKKGVKAPTNKSGVPRESLHIEVAKKVASTIACLYGAHTESDRVPLASDLNKWWQAMTDSRIASMEKSLIVVLFLEGHFDITNSKTRDKKMMMQALQRSIKKKLFWLNCRVSVVDTDTYTKQYFTVKRE